MASKRARRWRTLGAVTLLVLVLSGARWFYEQAYLTAGMRRMLIRCTSTEEPPGPHNCALSGTHAQVHTRRDRRMYLELRRAIQLSTAADAVEAHIAGLQQAKMQSMRETAHSERLMRLTERAYLSSHVAISAVLDNDIASEFERREREQANEERAIESESLLGLQQRLDARFLWRQIRAELGLATEKQ